MKRLLPFAAILLLIEAAPGANGQPLVTAVESIGFSVADADRSARFFADALDFERVGEHETWGRPFELLDGLFGARARTVVMRLGAERLELTEYLAPRGRPYPADTRANDRWFQHIAIVVRDMAAAYERLRSARAWHASTGPQRLPDSLPAAAGIEAFYFRDPDLHFLEVIRFPAGKGDARWHQPSGRLFLGIDHTAVVVADTDASLRFYRDLLGLRIAGGSENFGEEQEHLNNVFGARLRITTLKAVQGPGIELLEYLAPRDGRPSPADLRASDLAHWRTTLVASADGAAVERALIDARTALVSPGAVSLPDDRLGFFTGVTTRDPDGHTMRVVAKDGRR